MERTVVVTSRSRNLGIGWTNQPRQTRAGLALERVERPSVVGTRRQVLEELERARRGNQGNAWRAAFFVGGRRVVPMDAETGTSFVEQLRLLQPGEAFTWALASEASEEREEV